MFLRKLKAYWLLKGRKQRQQQREEQRNLQQELHAKLIGDNLYSFHGGLTLHYGKNFTSSQPVYLLQNPELFLISAVQHKGDKALITVAEQDTVTAGQALTSQFAPNDLAVHSPVEGKVVGILDYLYAAPLQKTCATIVVQATGRNNTLGWPNDALARLTVESQAWRQEQTNLEAGLGNDAADDLISQAVDRRAIRDFEIAKLPERLGLGGVTFDSQGQAHATWARILDFSKGTPIGPASLTPLDCYSAPTKDLLLQIKLAGIAGLGGAVFPTERKINRRAFKTLLINAAECEPYITCDDALMQHYSQELVLSWLCMQRVLQCENIVVAIEDDKQVAYQALAESLKLAITLLQQQLREVRGQRSVDSSLHNFFTEQSAEFFANKEQLTQRKQQQDHFLQQILGQPGTNWQQLTQEKQIELLEARLQVLQAVHLRVLPTKYPSGNQRTTIEVLTGYSLSKRQNFTSLGAICLNVATVYSCYRAITFGEVLTQRLVTITGLGIAQPGNYWLPFGITPAYLAEKLGTTPGFTGKVIIGGPMMGYPLDDLNTPINKATNCMIFVSQDEVDSYPRLFAPKQEQACIRCTACQEHCPILLQPQQLYWFSKNKDDQKLIKANLSACIECGLCDYVCPSDIPLVSYFQESKTRIYQAREKERNAAEARVRFERKEAREALEREQREAKRAADKARNQERAASMRAKTMAETGVDPVVAAKARLAARGVETGRTIVQEAGNAVPDNSAIMEQRRLRRLAKQAEQNSQVATPAENSTTVPLDRSAVLAAVNRAKAKQAAAQGATLATSSVEVATESQALRPARPLPHNIQEQIARAKARQAAEQGENSATGETTFNATSTGAASPRRVIPANIQEQITRAKANQAQAQGQVQEVVSTPDVSPSEFLALDNESLARVARPQRAIPANIQEQIARAKYKQAQAREQTSESVAVPAESPSEFLALEQAAPQATLRPQRAIPANIQEQIARAKSKQAQACEQALESVAVPAESPSEFLALEQAAPQATLRPQCAIPANVQEQIARAKARQAAQCSSQAEDAPVDKHQAEANQSISHEETTAAVELTASSYQMPIAQTQQRRVNPRVAEAVARAKAKQAERNSQTELYSSRDEQAVNSVAQVEQQGEVLTHHSSSPVQEQAFGQEHLAQALASAAPKSRATEAQTSAPRAKRPIPERVANMVARAKAQQATPQTELAVFPSSEVEVSDSPRVARATSLGDIFGLEQEDEQVGVSTPEFSAPTCETVPQEFYAVTQQREEVDEPNPLDLIIASNQPRTRTFVPDIWEQEEVQEQVTSSPRAVAPQFSIQGEMRTQYEQQRQGLQLGGVNPRSRCGQGAEDLGELFAQEESTPVAQVPTPQPQAQLSRQQQLLAQRQERIAAIAARAKANHQRSKENR